MTRKEAIEKYAIVMQYSVETADRCLRGLEILGLIKFEEKKSVIGLWLARLESYGTIKVEEWPEGLVVWVGGQIRYKSWNSND